MKKTILLSAALVLLFSTLACDLPTSENSEEPSGSILLNLPDLEATSRGKIDGTYALNTTNTYEAFIYNETTFISSRDTTSSIAVPVGTYNVVVLAGYQSSTIVFLLGSGYSENVIVEQDKRTSVTITLITPTVDLTTPAEVIAGRDFEVSYSANFNNPKLYMSGGGSFYLDVGGSMQAVKYFGTTSLVDSVFSCSQTVTAFASPIQLKVSVSYTSVGIYDYSSSVNWCMPDYYWAKIAGVSENVVSVIEDPTGIGIDVVWE